MNNLVVAATLAVLLWIVWQVFQRGFRCGYCGRLAAHDPHCPYDIVNKERQ